MSRSTGRTGGAMEERKHDMLSLLKTKLAVSVLGAALVVGGGGAALAATHTGARQAGAQPASSLATATRSAGSHTTGASQANQTHVSIEGILTTASVSTSAATKGTGTIAVQEHGKSAATQVAVNANTRVHGWHAHSLADLAAAKGHRVQVQATKQKDGTLLAWKITVQGPAAGQEQDHDQGQSTAANHGHSQDADKSAHPGQSGQHGQSHSATGTKTPGSAPSSND